MSNRKPIRRCLFVAMGLGAAALLGGCEAECSCESEKSVGDSIEEVGEEVEEAVEEVGDEVEETVNEIKDDK